MRWETLLPIWAPFHDTAVFGDELAERSSPLDPPSTALAARDEILPRMGAIVVVEVTVRFHVLSLLLPVDEGAGICQEQNLPRPVKIPTKQPRPKSRDSTFSCVWDT